MIPKELKCSTLITRTPNFQCLIKIPQQFKQQHYCNKQFKQHCCNKDPPTIQTTKLLFKAIPNAEPLEINLRLHNSLPLHRASNEALLPLMLPRRHHLQMHCTYNAKECYNMGTLLRSNVHVIWFGVVHSYTNARCQLNCGFLLLKITLLVCHPNLCE